MQPPPSLLHRIRWGNVARVAALVILAVVIGAWPKLRGAPPDLPPDRAEPVVAPSAPPAPPTPTTTSRPQTIPAPPPAKRANRPKPAKHSAERRRPHTRRRHARTPPVRPAVPAPPPAPAPQPAAPAPPSPPAPSAPPPGGASGEFGF